MAYLLDTSALQPIQTQLFEPFLNFIASPQLEHLMSLRLYP